MSQATRTVLLLILVAVMLAVLAVAAASDKPHSSNEGCVNHPEAATPTFCI